MTHILAIDQGTTSSRAILFDDKMAVIYPQSGWVEHDVEEIWESVISRETTIVWNRETGKAIHNAIVWQDRRTAAFCEELKTEGFETTITAKTGLLADPYFSATKVRYILQELAFGTVDSFLIWRMTGGKRHVTDATNAARTMLYDIREGRWSKTICERFLIVPQILGQQIYSGELPILGVAGDQQAATIGQACFEPGMLKSTYGTGCFALLNTGDELVTSQNRLLGTIAYQLDGKPTYALEGSIFIAGAVVQWLRDGLGIIAKAADTHPLAEKADPSVELYLVPAFTGLGAPYWDAEARGAIYGLTRNSGPAEFARAALESVGFQTRDLLEAMHSDWSGEGTLRVDGGMSASDWSMQFLADIIGAPVDRPKVLETTALGAAWLAGMRAGVYPEQSEFAATWALDHQFEPTMDSETQSRRYSGWQDAIARTRGGAR
ncbi:Glycerol kinase [Nymphon striatum]|nr:Glycerol kinase [Nymphon striatum]